jgi:hypothetical protein
MPKKCAVIGCDSNYDTAVEYTKVFKVCEDSAFRDLWLSALPKRADFNPKEFYVCIKHWKYYPNIPTTRLQGGHERPTNPPDTFPGVPQSCVPASPTAPRTPIPVEDRQLQAFNRDDALSFKLLNTKLLQSKLLHALAIRHDDVYILLVVRDGEFVGQIRMKDQTLQHSDIHVEAVDMKFGDQININSYADNRNNQLRRWSQLSEIVNAVRNHEPTRTQWLQRAKLCLTAALITSSSDQTDESNRRLAFLRNQIVLNIPPRRYSAEDYVIASGFYPHARYDLLRSFIVLPRPRRMIDLKGRASCEVTIKEVLKKAAPRQKLVKLMIDEVKDRASLILRGHSMLGAATDRPESLARSCLCIMMTCLSGGMSAMVSMTPVHTLSAGLQFEKIQAAIKLISELGGHVVETSTDNLRTNAACYRLFEGIHFEIINVWRINCR